MCSISWKRCRNTWMTGIVPFWKIFRHGQKNFRQESAKLKYWWLQSSRLKMSRYSLFCVYSKTLAFPSYNYKAETEWIKSTPKLSTYGTTVSCRWISGFRSLRNSGTPAQEYSRLPKKTESLHFSGLLSVLRTVYI